VRAEIRNLAQKKAAPCQAPLIEVDLFFSDQ
jgi:hypothetical protein